MQAMTIQLDREDGCYVPGEPITGWVAWDVAEDPERVTVRLYWQTAGKGDEDLGIIAEQVFQPAGLRAEHPFEFEGVDGPYSFSGSLITLAWKVEAVVERGDAHFDTPLTLSPTGKEVRP